MTLDQLIQWDQHATLWLNNLGDTTWDPFWAVLHSHGGVRRPKLQCG